MDEAAPLHDWTAPAGRRSCSGSEEPLYRLRQTGDRRRSLIGVDRLSIAVATLASISIVLTACGQTPMPVPLTRATAERVIEAAYGHDFPKAAGRDIHTCWRSVELAPLHLITREESGFEKGWRQGDRVYPATASFRRSVQYPSGTITRDVRETLFFYPDENGQWSVTGAGNAKSAYTDYDNIMDARTPPCTAPSTHPEEDVIPPNYKGEKQAKP